MRARRTVAIALRARIREWHYSSLPEVLCIQRRAGLHLLIAAVSACASCSKYNDGLVLLRRSFLFLPLGWTAACRPRRGSGFPGYAFVANQQGRAIAVVDLMAFALTRHIPLPGAPSSVLAVPARKRVYVLTPESGSVHEIDTSRLAPAREFRARGRLVSMRAASDGEALWILSAEPRQLLKVSLDDMKVKWQANLPAEPWDFELSPDGRTAAVSLGTAGSLSLVDLEARRVGKPVPTGEFCGALRFRGDGRQVLAADPARRRLVIVEAASARVVTSLALAVKPENLCFKADGGELFVTGEGMDAVVIVSPYYTEVAETVLAGRAPGAMAISRSPEYLFVANPPTGDVTILDVETRRVVAVAPVGEEPGFIVITPDDQYALILDRRTGNMAVIRLSTVVPRRTRGAPLFTTIPVGSGPVSAVVAAVA